MLVEQTILVVEDDAVTRARLSFLLRKHGFRVELAEDGERGWALYQARDYSLVLTDWSMPGMDGLELCRLIRGLENEKDYTYIILITGQTEKAQVRQGLEAGADDYVTKPFDSGELLARLRTGQRILDLQDSMRKAQRKLEELASRDGLTGVLNRRALEERLKEAFNYCGRRGVPLTITMLDLDHFKRINDNFGHQVGDDVLRCAASSVSSVIREYDSVGRFGGEEFMVILPEADANEGFSVADRVRNAVSASNVCTKEGASVPVTVSVGMATIQPGYSGTVESLVESADEALYRAKRNGRNRVECADGAEFQLPTSVAV